MSAHEFTVERRQIPATRQHGWVAVHDATGSGTGIHLGRYPEIAAWLAGKGLSVTLDYCRARGDSFNADHAQAIYTWTFNTCGGIVVKDIPRLIAGLTVQL